MWSNNRLRLIVTDGCNINCFYCHNEGQPKGNHFIPTELVEHIVKLIIQQGTGLGSITFSGGEPLLHPQLERFIDVTSKHASRVTLVTNGLLLTGEKLDALLSAGVSKIRLGVDSLLHASSRPSKGGKHFQSISHVIDLLISRNAQFELNVVLTKFNEAEIPALISFCRENKVSAKFFERVSVSSFGNGHTRAQIRSQPLVPFATFQKAILSQTQDLTIEYPSDVGKANRVYHGEGFTIRYCHYLCDFGLCYITGTRIDSRGSVFSCMGKRGLYRISSDEPLATSAEIIKRAISDRCSTARIF